MNDPALPLQKAMYDALAGSTVVMAIASDVYDRIPPDAAFPYVSLGPVQVIQDFDQCHDGAEVYAQVDCWSRAVGMVEVKTLAAAVSDVLDAALTLVGHEVLIHEVQNIRYLTDPDGLTSHAVVEMHYFTQPA
ncbi:MAG: DUF3168 domain-containing protein [Minisyncoccia bacterium]